MTTPITYSVHGKEESPIFGEEALHLKACDEAGGLFFEISQCSEQNDGKIIIDLEQLKKITRLAEDIEETWPDK